MKHIVWTRPAEDWENDQKFMRSTQNVVRFPLTRQIEICPKLPEKSCDLVILTSKKAATAFIQKSKLTKEILHRLEYVTFGLETYKYLLGQNLKARLIEATSGKKFAEQLVQEVKKTVTLWFPRPIDIAFELSEYLRGHGYEVYDVALYKTEPVKTLEAADIQRLISEPCIVCLASPGAVKSFIDIVLSYDNGRFNRYLPVVIGPTTKASAQSYFRDVAVAAQPTLQSLYDKAYEIARREDLRTHLS